MKRKSKVGQIALAKLFYHKGLKEYCAILTSSEALYLIEIGCKLSRWNNYQKDEFLDEVRRGANQQHNCYFDRVPSVVAIELEIVASRRQKKAFKTNRQ